MDIELHLGTSKSLAKNINMPSVDIGRISILGKKRKVPAKTSRPKKKKKKLECIECGKEEELCKCIECEKICVCLVYFLQMGIEYAESVWKLNNLQLYQTEY